MLRHLLLASVLLTISGAAGHAQDGWRLFRGNAERTSAAAKLPAWDKRVAWQRPLFMDKHDVLGEIDPDQAAQALIEKLRKDADPSILPGFFPLIADDLCLYRGHRDARAVSLKTITVVDDMAHQKFDIAAGHIVWESIPADTDVSVLLAKPQLKRDFDQIAKQLEQSKQSHWWWANPMTGTASADKEMLYVIYDLPISAGKLKDAAKLAGLGNLAFSAHAENNTLCAYIVENGKIVWGIGPEIADRAKEGLFLGAPVTLDKKIHALNERAGELRLLTLDPAKRKPGQPPPVDKTLTLLKVPAAEIAANHTLRRTQPLHLAHAAGLLVCPTHAGVLVGVDRAKMGMRWTYRYRDEKTPAPSLPCWQAASPVIHKESILFTAADSPDVHCIDLDGKKLWSAPATDKDLYLATVHDDIVLLVGKTHCRALSLKDGQEKWKLETGLTAGVGVRDGATYYLPLKRADGPTIWVIDLTKGTKTRALKVPHADALGNLILHRGMFVSQSVTHIAAFPLK